jgi:hypothetical protein
MQPSLTLRPTFKDEVTGTVVLQGIFVQHVVTNFHDGRNMLPHIIKRHCFITTLVIIIIIIIIIIISI